MWNRGTASLAGALLASAGCGSAELFVTLPPTDGARAMLLALNTGERLAFDLADGSAQLDWPRARVLPAVEAWMYARTLEQLGLSAGPIPEDPAGALLPRPDGAFRLDFARGERAWTAGSTAAGPLSTLRIPRPETCRPLHVENLLVGGETLGVPTATALGDGRMLLVLTSGALWAASESETQLIALVGLSTFTPSAVAVDADGTLYLASEEGQLARGTLVGTTVHAALLGDCRPEVTQLAVGPAGEVFAIAMNGDEGTTEMVRFEAGSCVHLADFTPSAAIDSRGGIAAPQLGVAYAGHSSGPFVYAYDHGVVSREQPSELHELILALTDDGAGGALAGTSRGTLLQRKSGRWNRLFSFDSDEAITALVPIPGGVLFGTVSGVVGYYTPADGVCLSADAHVPNRPVVATSTLRGAWLFAGARPLGTGPTQVGVVRFAD